MISKHILDSLDFRMENNVETIGGVKYEVFECDDLNELLTLGIEKHIGKPYLIKYKSIEFVISRGARHFLVFATYLTTEDEPTRKMQICESMQEIKKYIDKDFDKIAQTYISRIMDS